MPRSFGLLQDLLIVKIFGHAAPASGSDLRYEGAFDRVPLQYQLGSQADTLVDNNLLYDIKQEVASELSFKGCPLPADRLHSSGYRPREAPGPLIYSDVPTNQRPAGATVPPQERGIAAFHLGTAGAAIAPPPKHPVQPTGRMLPEEPAYCPPMRAQAFFRREPLIHPLSPRAARAAGVMEHRVPKAPPRAVLPEAFPPPMPMPTVTQPPIRPAMTRAQRNQPVPWPVIKTEPPPIHRWARS